MKIKLAAFMAVVLVLGAAASLHPAVAQDNSSTNPADVGSRVRSMVELGSVYSNIYDIAITVQETVRGEEALKRLKAASADNKEPAEGFDYVLAKVKFEIRGRTVSDTLSMGIGDAPLQWVALSSELIEYPMVSLTAPKPQLVGRVKSGDSLEGWVAFAVDSKDSKPVMVFDPDTGGATGRGRTLFFKLY